MIYVIDDDREVRLSLSFQLSTLGYPSQPYIAATDFLDALDRLTPGCLLLDIAMPDMDGLEMLATLERRAIDWPVIVMTGHGEVSVAVTAMKRGAIEFLEKPFEETLLVDALRRGFDLLAARTQQASRQTAIRAKLETLSAREREVLVQMIRGDPNKQIGAELGLSIRTVEMHRANLIAKLGTKSTAEAIALVAPLAGSHLPWLR